MKVCVVGAGAIGGFLAARLSLGGHDTTLVARGARLSEIQTAGIAVQDSGGTRVPAPEVRIVTSLRDLPNDPHLVFLATKAHQLPPVAPELSQLAPGSGVVSLQNGIPWWYFPSRSLDPSGELARAIPAENVVGAVVYAAAEVTGPGKYRTLGPATFMVGPASPAAADLAERTVELLTASGLRAKPAADIREEIWKKLAANLALNPLSALARARLEQIAADEAGERLVRALIAEAQAVASAIGVRAVFDADRILQGARKAGGHKTSMLQDVEQGRSLEIAAITGAVLELAVLNGLAIPHVETLHACASLLSRNLFPR
jgi:2-dehydropantoate 2-reductase